MVPFRLTYKGKVAEWEVPPHVPELDRFAKVPQALSYLTPEREQQIYCILELPKEIIKASRHEVRVVREARLAREEREEKERTERERKAQQDAASKAKSQALQRAAREAEERAREAAFQRALEKRDALAAEAQAKAAEEAQREIESAHSRPRKRNYRQRQKHKQQQREAVEAKQLEMKLATQLGITDAPPPPESDPEDEKLCSICMEGEKTHACLPCGHRCLCASCAEPSLKLETCPICRVPVLMCARIFV